MQTEEPGQRNGDPPHGNQPHQQRKTGITGGAQRVDHHDVEGPPRLQQQADKEQLGRHRHYVGIFGEQRHQEVAAAERHRDHHHGGHQQPQLQAAQQLAIGQLELASPHHVANQDLGTQADGETEQQDEQADLEEEGLGRQRLVTHQGHKRGHHHELQHPGEVFAGRGQADMHDLAQHLTLPLEQLAEDQTDTGPLLQQVDQQSQCDQTTGHGTPGHPGHPHLGQTKEAEQQQGIADKGDQVGSQGDIHGLAGMTMGAQGRRHAERRRLRQQAQADHRQVDVSVAHQVFRHVHQVQQPISPQDHRQRGQQPHQQVEPDGGMDHPPGHAPIARAQILGNHYAGSDADEVEQRDAQIEDLVAHGQGRDRLIGDLAHHEGVERPGQKVKGDIDEERPGQLKQRTG